MKYKYYILNNILYILLSQTLILFCLIHDQYFTYYQEIEGIPELDLQVSTKLAEVRLDDHCITFRFNLRSIICLVNARMRALGG